MLIRVVIALLGLGALVACSGATQREEERDENRRYVEYAGDPIDHFSTLRKFNGWRAIAKDQLVVWAGTDIPYLLTLIGPCDDVRNTTTVALASKSNEVNLGDSVIVGRQTCRISEIRPIDHRRLAEDAD